MTDLQLGERPQQVSRALRERLRFPSPASDAAVSMPRGPPLHPGGSSLEKVLQPHAVGAVAECRQRPGDHRQVLSGAAVEHALYLVGGHREEGRELRCRCSQGGGKATVCWGGGPPVTGSGGEALMQPEGETGRRGSHLGPVKSVPPQGHAQLLKAPSPSHLPSEVLHPGP